MLNKHSNPYIDSATILSDYNEILYISIVNTLYIHTYSSGGHKYDVYIII